MEKKKYDICLEVLRRFAKVGILKDIVLVGSWCLYFYKKYYVGISFAPTIRTRDIDFLVPLPSKIKKKIDIPELLKDIGFVVEFAGSQGYIRLGHPELIIEFLVPERGRGSNKPYPLPQISLNAQPLRYLDFLIKNTIEISAEGTRIRLPHPIAFALHKLIILGRRAHKGKAEKDREQALRILHLTLKRNETNKLRKIFSSMPKKWQKNIQKTLQELGEEEGLKALA